MSESYIPPIGSAVDFNFTDANSFVISDPSNLNFNFSFSIPEAPCDKKWQIQPYNGISLNFSGCPVPSTPTWVDVPFNGIVADFKCCPIGPVECLPDWLELPFNGIDFDFTGCDISDPPDWVDLPFNAVNIDIVCCEPSTECLPDFLDSNDVSITTCDDTDPPDWTPITGDVNISFRCCETDVIEAVTIGGFPIIDGITSESEIITAESYYVSGTSIIDPVVSVGEVTFTYRYTVTGDSILEVTSTNGTETGGVRFYWSNVKVPEVVSNGVLSVPYAIFGTTQIEEITSSGVAYVYPTNVNTNIDIGDIITNRGYIEVGAPIAPAFRQIYEASNTRSMSVFDHPEDAKYPVYVPTTDYTLENVELRRGTLEYTIEFPFDTVQVNRVIVWKMDSDGNATKDSIAKWLGGPLFPHELTSPFRYFIKIPLHCVTSKEFDFFLEVEYFETRNDQGGTVFLSERKSHIMPFQAHYDRREFMNMTDRFSMMNIEPNGSLFQSEITVFGSTFEMFNDSMTSVGAMSDDNPILNIESFNQTLISLELTSFTSMVGRGSIFPVFERTYFNLDIGQIGG